MYRIAAKRPQFAGTARLLEQPSKTPLRTGFADASQVPVLNRVTFNGNVHRDSEIVEHWLVMFCVEWWEPCRVLRRKFHSVALQHGRSSNANSILQLQVRFAEVDCTVDRVLCNEQQAGGVLKIVHYHRGTSVASWTLNSNDLEVQMRRMSKFLTQQTELATGDAPQGVSARLVEHKKITAEPSSADTVTTAFRVVPFAIALVGVGAWTVTQGMDFLFQMRRFSQPLGNDGLEKNDHSQATELHSHLPETWTLRHRRIEL